MKKHTLLSRKGLLAMAVLLASSVGGLYSCQKNPQEAPAPAPAASPFEAMRSAFNAAGHEQALTQPFGDSARLRWEPTWRAAHDKTDPTGVVYTYVPLIPALVDAGGRQRAGEFHMVGTQRFIIAKHVGNAYSFDLATYTVAQPDSKAASTKRRTFAEAAAQPILFAAFSGKLSLQGLTSEKHAIFSYLNGGLVSSSKKIKSKALAALLRMPMHALPFIPAIGRPFANIMATRLPMAQ
ncbi:hypothetical protein [Hymenobacter cheonanensis]|uniref:hypothetical protein n=1 Tax=Hymenobacter sp. CA2-7 TaxID=3063993 RepID=UPI002712F030|nr:hypothetical protein [Hymenobacter sp. CA2-7]MDO7887463.1 hypothetical protein [Hymenobacter sp. CA2-7]